MPEEAGIQLLALALRALLGVLNHGFRSPRRRAGYFPLSRQRKVTKGKTTPASAPIGRCPIGTLRCSPPSGRRTTRPSMASDSSPFPAGRLRSSALLQGWVGQQPEQRQRQRQQQRQRPKQQHVRLPCSCPALALLLTFPPLSRAEERSQTPGKGELFEAMDGRVVRRPVAGEHRREPGGRSPSGATAGVVFPLVTFL